MRFSILRYTEELFTQLFCLWTYSENFEAFQRDNVLVRFFTPNAGLPQCQESQENQEKQKKDKSPEKSGENGGFRKKVMKS